MRRHRSAGRREAAISVLLRGKDGRRGAHEEVAAGGACCARCRNEQRHQSAGESAGYGHHSVRARRFHAPHDQLSWETNAAALTAAAASALLISQGRARHQCSRHRLPASQPPRLPRRLLRRRRLRVERGYCGPGAVRRVLSAPSGGRSVGHLPRSRASTVHMFPRDARHQWCLFFCDAAATYLNSLL